MIQLILILTLIWLLIGALTFSFASVNKTVIMTHWTVIKCTLLGALSLFILVTNYLRDQELEREKYRHNQNIKL